jgi:hypothetical protein
LNTYSFFFFPPDTSSRFINSLLKKCPLIHYHLKAPGTYIHRDLYQSKAFIALKGVSPQLLVLILGKRKFDGIEGKKVCTNSDYIPFTYIEAKEEYGITQPRFTRGIDDLLAKGFITVKHQGGAYQQDKTIYGLSENWRLWRPGVVFEKRQKDICQRGFRKPKKKRVLEVA